MLSPKFISIQCLRLVLERHLVHRFKMKANYHVTSTCLFSLIQKRLLRTPSTGIFSPPPCSSTLPKAPLLENSPSLPSAVSVRGKPCLDQNDIHIPQSMLHFLKSHHFDDNQIARLVKKAPRFLYCGVEDNLKPKFEFLIANGISGKVLSQIISSTPQISGSSLESKIKPCFEFLKSYVDCDEKIALAIKRFPLLLCSDLNGTMQLNIDLLIKEGVPLDRISILIASHPITLLHSHDRFIDVVNAVKILGLQPEDTMFVYALRVRIQMNERSWKKKIETMKSLGWSEEKTSWVFRRCPQILVFSEKKIKGAMDFFVNAAGLERKIIFSHPELLCYSVDKRVRPRYHVMNVLLSKNLIKKDMKITSLLSMSEKKFLENCVVKYADEVPGLLEMFVSATIRKNKDA